MVPPWRFLNFPLELEKISSFAPAVRAVEGGATVFSVCSSYISSLSVVDQNCYDTILLKSQTKLLQSRILLYRCFIVAATL